MASRAALVVEWDLQVEFCRRREAMVEEQESVVVAGPVPQWSVSGAPLV